MNLHPFVVFLRNKKTGQLAFIPVGGENHEHAMFLAIKQCHDEGMHEEVSVTDVLNEDGCQLITDALAQAKNLIKNSNSAP